VLEPLIKLPRRWRGHFFRTARGIGRFSPQSVVVFLDLFQGVEHTRYACRRSYQTLVDVIDQSRGSLSHLVEDGQEATGSTAESLIVPPADDNRANAPLKPKHEFFFLPGVYRAADFWPEAMPAT